MEYIKRYIGIFFTMFGVYYLVNEIEIWQQLFTDSKIKFAFIMTMVLLIIDISKKYSQSKEKE